MAEPRRRREPAQNPVCEHCRYPIVYDHDAGQWRHRKQRIGALGAGIEVSPFVCVIIVPVAPLQKGWK